MRGTTTKNKQLEQVPPLVSKPKSSPAKRPSIKTTNWLTDQSSHPTESCQSTYGTTNIDCVNQEAHQPTAPTNQSTIHPAKQASKQATEPTAPPNPRQSRDRQKKQDREDRQTTTHDAPYKQSTPETSVRPPSAIRPKKASADLRPHVVKLLPEVTGTSRESMEGKLVSKSESPLPAACTRDG